MNKTDGMNYAPTGKPQPVVKPGEFVIAAATLDHGHIYGMCNGLIEAGATLKWVYDPDPAKVEKFLQQYPQAQVADSLETILNDRDVRLVAGAAIPSERCPLGLKVMTAGKDYFTDKAPLTTLEQLEDAKAMVAGPGASTRFTTASACTLKAQFLRAIWSSGGNWPGDPDPGHRPAS